jgi:hypothetical protein
LDERVILLVTAAPRQRVLLLTDSQQRVALGRTKLPVEPELTRSSPRAREQFVNHFLQKTT